MVRHPGMSRGCATCRKRRIKCDEKIPSCSQCSRGRRPCPGATGGKIFLFTQAGNPRKCSRIPPQPSELRNNDNPSNSLKSSKESSDFVQSTVKLNRKHGQSQEMGLNIVASHTPTTFIGTQAVSQFISFFAKSAINKTKSNSWMNILPDMLASGSRIELRSSVLAAAFALYSTICQDTSSEMEARRLYVTGLKQQRVKMILASHSSERIIPKVEDVAMAVMLAYYEVISPTTDTAYFQHILGAKVLLEMIGPQNCQEGYFHQLFQTVRLYMVYISITTKSTTIFASESWTEIPFRTSRKTTCDRIVDVLLQLPQIWVPPNNNVPEQRASDLTLRGFMNKLKAIWKILELGHQVMASHMDLWDTDRIQMHGIDLYDFVPGPVMVTDSETAITTALYSLAWIYILDEIQTRCPEMQMCERLLLGHCDAVLRAGHFIEDFEDGCGLIRMAFPLRSVALLSPDPLQREYAKYRLELWRVNRGLGGICAVVTAPDNNISAGRENQYTS
ncbi:hypothetical protein BGW36DRAFT_403660 [Talaromyces proteolyticus]|uniref:Zn(2)-C6 fungal-type domain-containing protein n=1 Tax=Talaromyces proteolyticus TaxID=1131652 RepID=A0AAD4KX86_9EURO|nr:uncharacterized protein BGW36DRAFT_403660 [Talaromyces proteolyticus]KAH8703211.1 hypothetical protein BGW36DRAFT_403660 [Talaromyces proteolyticus]